MALAALPTNPAPDGTIDHQFEPNVERIQFGDGYVGRWAGGKGKTSASKTYTFRYTSLNQTERDTIYNFVTNLRGAAFTYQWTHEASPRKFIAISRLRQSRTNGDIYDLEFDLEEVNDYE